jgi:PIN domain nuclease of toxin-antitoxin system
MLVSQALVEGVTLLTVDGRLSAYEALGLRMVR